MLRKIYYGIYFNHTPIPTPFNIDIEWPEKEDEIGNNSTITYITVKNMYGRRTERIYGDKINIIAGGIGHKYVKMNIESNQFYPFNYRITMYTDTHI